ncbi:tRNA (adenosine(37)-N6)-threonylcarbamoyltransferase complex ATPase subunit type 1 TsaE [Bacillota bacterium LX-D]|nr:tRNA (adenosine(37)-N6)-threonylcarbamoyltransferase complex ATPase subunit type 1 TsaE [Bacillota bacterium LX-D]
MLAIRAQSAKDTKEIGSKLSGLLQPGDCLRLEGGLGAGKTTFTQGVCAGLGVTSQVTSPTFTILHQYQGKIPVYHIDAYRIESSGELNELGLEEFIEGDGVCLIEWAEKVSSLLPNAYLQVELLPGEKEDERLIKFTPINSERFRVLVGELKAKCEC